MIMGTGHLSTVGHRIIEEELSSVIAQVIR